jgi:copper(I)-binding protein
MLELIWALVAAPLAQDTATEPPTSARSGDLTVSQGGMMAWSVNGGLGGQVTALVDNAGSGTDRILSVTTPSGTVGNVGVYPLVNGRGERAPNGDLTIRPGRTGVLAELTDLASGVPAPVLTTVTITFEQAGAVTIRAMPASPAPPSPPR